MSELREAFVRAVNKDGTIQIGHADPDQPYGHRPVEIITVSATTAATLGAQLFAALVEAHVILRNNSVVVVEPPEN